MAKSKAVAILAEMGTGKTMITIALAGALYNNQQINKMLIVAPLSIVPAWDEEIKRFADYDFNVAVLDGSASKKCEALQNLFGKGLQIAIINYESCWRIEKMLHDWQPDLIVCDESSKIKNPQAKQSKALHRLGKISKHNLILTGTPVTNNPLDFYSQYKFLDEKIFGSSYYAFRSRYAILGGYGNHQVIGYKNLPELTQKAHEIAFRITKAEALDLPEQVDQTRYVTLEPSVEKLYRNLEKESVAELEQGHIIATNVLTKLLRLSQLTGGHMKLENSEDAYKVSDTKLNALAEIIDELAIGRASGTNVTDECLDAGKKLVVFARFVPEIDAIANLLKNRNIGYALIKGDVKDRAGEVAKFQNDTTCKVFVGQIQTTGMGLTLTAADTAVFYSLDYSFSNYEQAKARIHRIGQKNNCTYIHLLAKNTIDEKVFDALKKKKSIADLVVDNWRSLFETNNEGENHGKRK